MNGIFNRVLLPTALLLLLAPKLIIAQQTPRDDLPVCVTPDLTDTQRKDLDTQAAAALRTKAMTNANPAAVTHVPIRPHIFRRTNGTGGLTLTKLNNIMAITNGYYFANGSGIQFYFCGTTPDYIDNDNLFNSFPAFEESSVDGHDASNAMNQYYVNAFSQNGLGGYAYFPYGNKINNTRSFILNEDSEADLANRLLPHELGHNFGLFHTFSNTGNGTRELVTRGAGANCLLTGDELCDTPADPLDLPGATITRVNGCQAYTGTARDAQGTLFAPSITNIMSYYFPCTHDLTPDQHERMQAGLALRQSHTAYSLDCPATAVAAPGNLSISLVNASVVLTWQDNAANEMGYFIERSTSATSGFAPVGGVGPNATTFTDRRTAGFTTYFYRIRPSNAITAGLSTVVSIATGTCHPAYDDGCTAGEGLNGFVVNGNTLSQNSGCSADGYQSFTATSTTLTAGQSYGFNGTIISSIYPQGVTVWADLDRDGTYDAGRNELLYQTPTPLTGQFSGTLALPANLATGPLSIRVIIRDNAIAFDPCGSYNYGETEDYVLSVVNPSTPTAQADLSLSMRVSNRAPMLDQPVGYVLTITNSGPDDATNVSWQNRLPPSLSFVGGDAGVVESGNVVSGNGLSLAGGASVTVGYRLKPTQPGTYVNAAQILNSSRPDPDSQPDSGTGDGQDDSALADIRTVAATDAVFVSPNPNQTALPPVSPNQPTPDPAKADLSLAMAVSNRTPAPGQSVTFTIKVRNAGGLVASNVVVRDTLRGLTVSALPPGVNVIGSGAGYTIIEGTIGSVAVNETAMLTFTATTTVSGYVRNSAQIWSAGQPDPDSTPGSATPTANNLNGEDDTAGIDLRVGS